MPTYKSATVISGTSGTVAVGQMTWVNGRFTVGLLTSVTVEASASADITLFKSIGGTVNILALTGVTTAQNKSPDNPTHDSTGTATGLGRPHLVEAANLGFTYANATNGSTITITVEVF